MLKAIVDRYTANEQEATKVPALSTFDPTSSCIQPVSITNINKIEASTAETLVCQLCADTPAQKAVVKCVQCAVLYCSSCREKCHPRRGPLAQHKLLDVKDSFTCDDGKVSRARPYAALPSKPLVKNGIKLSPCPQHPTENTSLHCEVCRVSLCVQCSEEGKHKNHEVKPIGALYKTQKVSQP